MRTFGATRADFGRIAVAQRANALANPNALFKVPLTIEQYLDARPIAAPIHLFDCVMPCAGAEAFLVMSEQRAKDLGLGHALVRGAIERHNAYADDRCWCAAAGRRDGSTRRQGPPGRRLRQTYDDYPSSSCFSSRISAFCAKGEDRPSFASTLTHAGDFPTTPAAASSRPGRRAAPVAFSA
jgi:hypothetical protein